MSANLGPGDVLVVDSSAAGKLAANGGGDVVFWGFSLRLDHLFPLFAGQEMSLLQGVADSLKTPRIHDKATSLAQDCHRLLSDMPPAPSLEHRGQLLRVAASVLSAEFDRERTARAGFLRVEERMIHVFERIKFEEILELSVDQVAAQFGCSRRQLNRLFHQFFGLSVASLRMEMRLLKAVSLLRDPRAKIANVAEQCGFHHLGLFNTCFKRRFGTSPGQWRKEKIEAEIEKANGPGPDCRIRKVGLCPWCAEDSRKIGSTICGKTRN
jgi:AraC-like DNA-binding protein